MRNINKSTESLHCSPAMAVLQVCGQWWWHGSIFFKKTFFLIINLFAHGKSKKTHIKASFALQGFLLSMFFLLPLPVLAFGTLFSHGWLWRIQGLPLFAYPLWSSQLRSVSSQYRKMEWWEYKHHLHLGSDRGGDIILFKIVSGVRTQVLKPSREWDVKTNKLIGVLITQCH